MIEYANYTQKYQVLQYMKEHGSITPMEAIREFGITRLAARISDLKFSGIRIRTVMERKVENGRRVSWARYYLVPEEVKTDAE